MVRSRALTGTDQQKKVKELSGGMRNQLTWPSHLSKAATCCCSMNLPTILDVNTLRALEEGLENFAGCAVIIYTTAGFPGSCVTHPCVW